MESLSIATSLPEGSIADGLTAIQHRYTDIDIGSYPQFVDGRGITTLVLRSPDIARNQLAGDEVRALIATLGGEEITA
jgi:hypothetical protein